MSSIDPAIQSVLDARQNSVQAQVGIAVQAKALESSRLQGDAMVSLIEEAARLGKSLHAGRNFDAQG